MNEILKEWVFDLIVDRKRLREEFEKVKAKCKALEQVLRKLEWSDIDPEFGHFCIECDASQGEPHYAECEIGKALAAVLKGEGDE